MNSCWKPPQDPFIKVNFDAAFKVTLHQSYSGFISRNSRGQVMGSETIFNKFASDSSTAKAIACLQALDFARDMGFTHVHMEGDSRTTIVKINQHVDRRANMVAHILAKERMSISEDRFWVEDLPAVAECYLARDLAGMASQS
ncbi:hypothetical protein J1N35_032073 [Gossypium stocksii]|uniref:RNase H type-1 domain-containing protein n=1 Tax=Gossypium stocksii TaxID=47602 RepID=A0A9D3ZUC6_9ROSI|nr:hypothetical protein J1N35_032073 [Gossypium stocksii]